MAQRFTHDLQYYKFCLYGFLKNLRFFEPFLLLFFLEKGLTYLQIGSLYAFREIVTNILEIPTGIIADAFGRRHMMILSFVSYIVSFLMFYVSSTYLCFAGAMLFFSLGEAFRTGTHKAMILEYLNLRGWNSQKVYYYGHTRSWSQLGSAVCSLIAAGIVFYSGSYRTIFLYATIPYIFDLLLMCTYPRELDGGIGRHRVKDMLPAFRRVTLEFMHSLKHGYTVKAIGNLSVFSGFHKAAKDYLQPVVHTFALSLPLFLFLEDSRRSALVIGIVYFFIYLLTSAASRKSGTQAARFAHLHMPLNISMMAGFTLGALCGLSYSLALPAPAIMLFVGIYLVQNVRKPMGVSYVSDLIRQDIFATALSAESQLSSFVAAGIALVIGFLADHVGIGNSLAVVSLLLLASSPLYLAKRPRVLSQPD